MGNSIISARTIVTPSVDLVSTELGGETVILHLGDGVYYGLDPVGTRIWSLIQTPQSVVQVRDALLEEYDVAPDRCLSDLLALLQDLANRNLIEVRDEAPASISATANGRAPASR